MEPQLISGRAGFVVLNSFKKSTTGEEVKDTAGEENKNFRRHCKT